MFKKSLGWVFFVLVCGHAITACISIVLGYVTARASQAYRLENSKKEGHLRLEQNGARLDWQTISTQIQASLAQYNIQFLPFPLEWWTTGLNALFLSPCGTESPTKSSPLLNSANDAPWFPTTAKRKNKIQYKRVYYTKFTCGYATFQMTSRTFSRSTTLLVSLKPLGSTCLFFPSTLTCTERLSGTNVYPCISPYYFTSLHQIHQSQTFCRIDSPWAAEHLAHEVIMSANPWRENLSLFEPLVHF